MVDIKDLDISKDRVITKFANNAGYVKTKVLVPRQLSNGTFRLNIPSINDTMNEARNHIVEMTRVEREFQEYLNGERCDRCGKRLLQTTATLRTVTLCEPCDVSLTESIGREQQRATAYFNIGGLTRGRTI